jgi:hypothetical protein
MQACYRGLRNYKYQLVEDYELIIPIKEKSIVEKFIELNEAGRLLIKKGYCWDGPSGPTIDTLTFMRGSLVHDALYQLIRMERLDLSYRDKADRIIRQICLEDGMNRIRAWYVYWSLRFFAKGAAIPGTQESDVIVCVPVNK